MPGARGDDGLGTRALSDDLPDGKICGDARIEDRTTADRISARTTEYSTAAKCMIGKR